MGEAPKEDKKRVQLAVFDYDGTCIDGQSGALFSLYLFRHNYLGVATGLRLGWWGARYKLHLPYRQDEAREVIFSALSHYSPAEIRQIMVDFHNEVLIKRYRKEAIAEVARATTPAGSKETSPRARRSPVPSRNGQMVPSDRATGKSPMPMATTSPTTRCSRLQSMAMRSRPARRSSGPRSVKASRFWSGNREECL